MVKKTVGIKEYNIVVKEKNFIKNMRTVYRESEDQLPESIPHAMRGLNGRSAKFGGFGNRK